MVQGSVLVLILNAVAHYFWPTQFFAPSNLWGMAYLVFLVCLYEYTWRYSRKVYWGIVSFYLLAFFIISYPSIRELVLKLVHR